MSRHGEPGRCAVLCLFVVGLEPVVQGVLNKLVTPSSPTPERVFRFSHDSRYQICVRGHANPMHPPHGNDEEALDSTSGRPLAEQPSNVLPHLRARQRILAPTDAAEPAVKLGRVFSEEVAERRSRSYDRAHATTSSLSSTVPGEE